MWFVHYEQGGVGFSDYLEVYLIENNKVTGWSYIREKPIDIDTLMLLIENNDKCLVPQPTKGITLKLLNECT